MPQKRFQPLSFDLLSSSPLPFSFFLSFTHPALASLPPIKIRLVSFPLDLARPASFPFHSNYIYIYIYFVRRNYTKILSRFIVSKWVETRKGNLQEQEKNLVSVSLFGNRGIFLRIELGSTSYVREPLNLFTGRVDFYLDLRLSLRHRIEYKSRITITQ